jgi:hypothetical protein
MLASAGPAKSGALKRDGMCLAVMDTARSHFRLGAGLYKFYVGALLAGRECRPRGLESKVTRSMGACLEVRKAPGRRPK